MELQILSDEKNSAEFKIDNVSVAEILRVYLNQVEGVRLAAWKREHPSKPLMFKIECEEKIKGRVCDFFSCKSFDLDHGA